MADEIISRDSNRVTVNAGITDDASQDIVQLRVDPITNRLQVEEVALQYSPGGSVSLGDKGNVMLASTGSSYKMVISDTDGHLQVDVLSGGSGGTLVSDGDAVNGTDTGQLVLGTDGSNYQVLSTDSSGHVQVDVLSGGGAGEQYATDTVTADAANKGNLVILTDGTTYRLGKSDSDGHFQVDVLSGGSGGTLVTDNEAVNGADTGQLILGTDGSNYQILHVNSTGQLETVDENIAGATSRNSIGISVAKLSLQPYFETTSGWDSWYATESLATTVIHRGRGQYFLTFNKNTDDTSAIISRATIGTDISMYDTHAFGHMNVYIPDTTNINKIYARVGTDSANFCQWDFAASQLNNGGWTDINEPISQPTSQTGNGYNLANVGYLAFGVDTNLITDVFTSIIIGGWAIKRAVESYPLSAVPTEVSAPFVSIRDHNSQTRLDVVNGTTYDYLVNRNTDGTNLMPTMDAADRKGYVSIVDGSIAISDGGNAITVDGSVSSTVSGSIQLTDGTRNAGITTDRKLQVTGTTEITSGTITTVTTVSTLTKGSCAISDGGNNISIDDGGNAITVDGTVTANLSATDNAVLDTIDAVLDSIQLAVGTEGDALADGILMQGDDGTDRTNVLVDTDGHLQADIQSGTITTVTTVTTLTKGSCAISDGGNSLTVDGTVNSTCTGSIQLYNGSVAVGVATNNRLLITGSASISGDTAADAVDAGEPVKIGFKAYNQDGTVPGTAVAELDRVNGAADLYGRQFVSIDHPYFYNVTTTYTSAQTATQLKAAPGAGLSLYITDLLMSMGDVAGTIRLIDGNAGGVAVNIVPPLIFAANGGVAMPFRTPMKLVANSSLSITSTNAVNHSVVVSGYIAP